MKKFLALVMALALLCSCFSFTYAETENVGDVSSCAGGHHDFGTNPVDTKTPATCTAEGIGSQLCNRCKQEIEVKIPMVPHVSKDGALPTEINPDPTCETPGTAHYAKCATCGKAFTKTVPALGHEYDDDKTNPKNYTVTAPTCTEKGYTTYFCLRPDCKHEKVVYDVEALGHDWIAASDPVDPTCYAPGMKGSYPVCARCYLVSTTPVEDADGNEIPVDAEYIAQLSHDESTAWGKAFVDEYFEYVDGVCVGVGDAVKEVGEKTVDREDIHAGKVTYDYKPATCTEDGYISVKCSCGAFERTEVLAAIKHFYDTLFVNYVDNEGNTRQIYVEMIDIIEWLGNKYGTEVELVADLLDLDLSAEQIQAFLYEQGYIRHPLMADCTIAPIVQYICTKCYNRVDAEGWTCDAHDFGKVTADMDWNTIPADWDFADQGSPILPLPTVMEITMQLYGHPYETPTVFKPWERNEVPVCTDAVVTVRCAHCAVTKDFTVKGLGHDMKKETVVRDSTCTSTGLKVVECTYPCGYSKAETIGMKPHTADPAKTVVVAATCTADGTRTETCSVCGTVYAGKVIPSYGHNYEWVTTKDPTCTADGLQVHKCTRCGDIDDENVLEEAHLIASWADIVAENNVDHYEYTVNSKGQISINKVIWKDCTKAGNVQFECINCKLVTIKHEPCKDHDLKKDGQPTTPSYTFVDDNTCKFGYKQDYECVDCAYTVTKDFSENQEHVWDGNLSTVLFVTADKPTCQKAGTAYKVCEHCGEYYLAEHEAFAHEFSELKYNSEKGHWSYICLLCGHEEVAVMDAEKYTIDTTGIKLGQKTTGTGVAKMVDELNNSFVLGERYVFLRWTFVTSSGDDMVASKVVKLNADGTFNAKGVSVSAGCKLTEMLIVVTDNENADDLDLNEIKNLGYVIL